MFNRTTRTTALVASGLAMLATTGVAEAKAPAKTKLTIQTQNGDFAGTVKSRKLHRCADQREITVYRQLGAQKNPATDEEVASDTAELHGRRADWETGNTGLRDGKRYYAYAAHIPGCRAAFSRTVTTVQDAEESSANLSAAQTAPSDGTTTPPDGTTSTARRLPIRPGEDLQPPNGGTKVVANIKGGSTGDGPATDADCERYASDAQSWIDASKDETDLNEADHDLSVAGQILNDGMDNGCFFYY
jgi:hypothetical protein